MPSKRTFTGCPAPATELLPLRGFTVGVTDASTQQALAGLLQRRGARVVPPAAEQAPANRRLVDLVVAGQVDALTFTSERGALAVLRVAEDAGYRDQFVRSLRTGVVAACLTPDCSAPLERVDVGCLLAAAGTLPDLVRAVVEQVPARRTARLTVAGHDLEIRGHVAILDGMPVRLPPAPMTVLRALARDPGRVCSRADLAQLLPGAADSPHAVEMAVTRLRAQLGQRRLVQTIVKRGYRLAMDAP
jgi:uroporphyrinogen-III synthase